MAHPHAVDVSGRLEAAAFDPLRSDHSCSSTRSSRSSSGTDEGIGNGSGCLSRCASEPTNQRVAPRVSEACSSSDGGAAAGVDENSVRVALRSRPLISRELLEGARVCVTVDEAARCVTLGRDRRFTFDHAFGAQSTQEQVYTECVAPLVEGCFEGYNATVLAYGQTGSGKTYSMGTGDVVHVAEQQLGITPRVIRHLFDGIARRQAGRAVACQVRAQFLEIHNEELKDLLHPDIPSKSMAIRESPDGEILVVGAGERPADSADELLQLLETGFCARSTGATHMNEQSSRSHAIFTIMLEQHMAPDGQGGPGEFRSAKLHLVDLAGSERTKKSGVLGARFKETVTINQGLLCLGNVISALGDERKRGGHVPYRASKLTRLLQGSLGGNSRTLMLATVSSADDSLEETLNTLKYANRARNIRNSPTPNRGNDAADAAGTQLSARQLAVHELRSSVLRRLLEAQGGGGGVAADAQLAQLRELLLADISTPHACAEAMRRLRSVLAADGETSAGVTGGTLPPWCVVPGELQLGGQVLLQRPSTVAAQQHAGRLAGQLAAAKAEAVACAADAAAARQLQVQAEEQLQRSLKAINGMMRALAEAEARRQVPPAVRDTIMKAVDAATGSNADDGQFGSSLASSLLFAASSNRSSLSLAPPPPSQLPPLQPSLRPSVGARVSVQSHPLQLLGLGDSQSEEALVGLLAGHERDASQHHHALEDRVRSLEAALTAQEVELNAARDDLQRDEVIFADKMRELAEARRAAEDAEARGQELEARLKHDVAALHEELQRHRAALLATRRVSSPRGATSPRSKQQYMAVHGQDPRHRLCRPRSAGAEDGAGGTPSRLASSPSGSTGRDGAGRPFIFRISEEDRAAVEGGECWQDSSQRDACGGPPYRPGGQQYEQEWGCGQDAVVLYDDELLSYISETDYTDQQAGAFFDGEVHHAEELNRVLQQRAVAEEERARLEAAAVEQQAAFDEQRDALEGQLATLATEIAAQESTMAALRRSEQEAREQGRAYLARMQQLEDQLAGKVSEVAQLRRDLQCVEEDVVRTEEQRVQIRQQYEERIAEVMEEMSALRQQLKDQDRQRVDRERLKAVSRAQQLEADLSRLHAQQAELQRQIMERTQRHKREAAQRQRETVNLRRAAELARKRLTELEAENREQRVQLRQKQAEVAQAQRRLKVLNHPSALTTAERGGGYSSSAHSSLDSGAGGGTTGRTVPQGLAGPSRTAGGTGGGWTPAGRSMTSHSRLTPSRLPRRNATGPAVPPAALLSQLQDGGERDVSPMPSRRDKAAADGAAGVAAVVQDPKLWLEPRVKVLAGRAGWEKKLQALAGRGEALQAERAALLDVRSRRQLKAMRRSAELRGQLAGLMSELAQAELDADEDLFPSRSSAGQATSRGILQQEDLAAMSHERDALEQRLRSRHLNSSQEQKASDALDDQLDAMEAEIEFVAGEAAAARAALARIDEARAQVMRHAAVLPVAEARHALQHLVELMSNASAVNADEASDQNDRTAQLEAALRASSAQLVELQDSVRAREAEVERRLAAAQQAQALRMQGVLSRLAPLMAGGGDEAASLAASLAGLLPPPNGGTGESLAASSSGCPSSSLGCPASFRVSSAVQASMCSSVRSSVGLGSSDLRQLIMMYRDRSTGGSTSSQQGSQPAPAPPAMAARSSAASVLWTESATGTTHTHQHTSNGNTSQQYDAGLASQQYERGAAAQQYDARTTVAVESSLDSLTSTPAPTHCLNSVPIATALHDAANGRAAAGEEASACLGSAASRTDTMAGSSTGGGRPGSSSILAVENNFSSAAHVMGESSGIVAADVAAASPVCSASTGHGISTLHSQSPYHHHALFTPACARDSLPSHDDATAAAALTHTLRGRAEGEESWQSADSVGGTPLRFPVEVPGDSLFDDCYGSAVRPGPLTAGGTTLAAAAAGTRHLQYVSPVRHHASGTSHQHDVTPVGCHMSRGSHERDRWPSSGGTPPPLLGRSSATSELLQRLKASARAKGLLVGHREDV